MAYRLRTKWTVLASLSMLLDLNIDKAFAVGYWESDNAIVETSPLHEPADLVHPNRSATVRVTSTGVGIGSGVLIAPNWIMSNAHVLDDLGFQAGFRINGVAYIVDSNGNEPMIFVHPDWPSGQGAADVALARIVKMDGTDANLSNWVPIIDAPPIATLTWGGYGQHWEFDEQTGAATLKGSNELFWGRNVFSLSNDFFLARRDHPNDDDYIKYEASAHPGDSGSGNFTRNGWEWGLPALISSSGDAVGPYLSNPDTLEWIQTTLGNEYPDTPLPTSKPPATIHWIGISFGQWNQLSNWDTDLSGSVLNGVPRFDPERSDIVHLSNSNSVQVSGDANAQDIYLTGARNGGALYINVGANVQADSIFLGPESGEIGIVLMTGGQIAAEKEYVGFRGTGSFVHVGGENKVTSLFVGKENEVGIDTTEYILSAVTNPQDAPSLQAVLISIGEGAGSEGVFKISPYNNGTNALAASKFTIVGDSGSGSFVQESGLHQIEKDLIVGRSVAGQGVYDLSGTGEVESSRTIVGDEGIGLFTHSSGSLVSSELIINEISSYALSGGVLDAAKIVANGTFEVSDGLVDAEVIEGTIDVDNANFDFRGIVNTASATFVNTQNAVVTVNPTGLLIVNEDTYNDIQLGNLDVETAGQPVHVSGDVLGITQHTVEADDVVVIEDPVIVTLNGVLQKTGEGNITLDNGLTWDSGGEVIVDVLNVRTGRQSGSASFVAPTDGTWHIPEIQVKAQGKIVLNGEPANQDDTANILNRGVVEIGPGVASLTVSHYLTTGPENPQDPTAQLNIDIADGSSDHLTADTVLLDRKLQLNLVDDPAEFSLGDEFEIITFSAQTVEATFDEIDFGEADSQFSSLLDEEILLAVLYSGDHIASSNVTVGNEVLVRVSRPGDINLDNVVDESDFAIFGGTYEPGVSGKTWADGDFNGDGIVDESDFAIFGSFYTGGSGSGGGAGVPEPASITLLVLAMFGAVGISRRR
ncbi:MAG: trypsin-like peptidase domain-containing protein [Pirellulales bacterium]